MKDIKEEIEELGTKLQAKIEAGTVIATQHENSKKSKKKDKEDLEFKQQKPALDENINRIQQQPPVFMMPPQQQIANPNPYQMRAQQYPYQMPAQQYPYQMPAQQYPYQMPAQQQMPDPHPIRQQQMPDSYPMPPLSQQQVDYPPLHNDSPSQPQVNEKRPYLPEILNNNGTPKKTFAAKEQRGGPLEFAKRSNDTPYSGRY